MSVFLGVALGVDLAFLGVAAALAVFLALGAAAAFFFCTAPAVFAGPFVMRPEAVLAEILVSSTMAGALGFKVSECSAVVDEE